MKYYPTYIHYIIIIIIIIIIIMIILVYIHIKDIRPLLSLKWHMIEVGIDNIKRLVHNDCSGQVVGGPVALAGRWGVGTGQNQWQSKEKGKEEQRDLKDQTLSKTEAIYLSLPLVFNVNNAKFQYFLALAFLSHA